MYDVSAQGIGERMINVHYYYYYKLWGTFLERDRINFYQLFFGLWLYLPRYCAVNMNIILVRPFGQTVCHFNNANVLAQEHYRCLPIFAVIVYANRNDIHLISQYTDKYETAGFTPRHQRERQSERKLKAFLKKKCILSYRSRLFCIYSKHYCFVFGFLLCFFVLKFPDEP